MGFQFEQLDSLIRALMMEEIDRDSVHGDLYDSRLLTPLGRASFRELLRVSARAHDADFLADGMASGENFIEKETIIRADASCERRVNFVNAARRLAEGEFNRYYMRAVCRRAMEVGTDVQVYRARESARHRTNSDSLSGHIYDARSLLAVLRQRVRPNVGVAAGIIPGDVNSGLSLRMLSRHEEGRIVTHASPAARGGAVAKAMTH